MPEALPDAKRRLFLRPAPGLDQLALVGRARWVFETPPLLGPLSNIGKRVKRRLGFRAGGSERGRLFRDLTADVLWFRSDGTWQRAGGHCTALPTYACQVRPQALHRDNHAGFVFQPLSNRTQTLAHSKRSFNFRPQSPDLAGFGLGLFATLLCEAAPRFTNPFALQCSVVLGLHCNRMQRFATGDDSRQQSTTIRNRLQQQRPPREGEER